MPPARFGCSAWSFWILLPILLMISAIFQILIYSGRGGILGYIDSYTRRDVAYQTESGLVAVLAECFPIIAMMGYAVCAPGIGR